jgi:hypothetical protein
VDVGWLYYRQVGSIWDLVVDTGSPITLTGTVVSVAASGIITYVRISLTDTFDLIPAGTLVSVIADHIVALSPVTGGGD